MYRNIYKYVNLVCECDDVLLVRVATQLAGKKKPKKTQKDGKVPHMSESRFMEESRSRVASGSVHPRG